MIGFLKALLMIFAALPWLSCDRVAGGSGTDVGNPTVSGVILEEDGQTAANTRVMLVPQSFNPLDESTLPESLQTMTGQNGLFKFESVDSGLYNLEALHLTKKTQLLVKSIAVKAQSVNLPAATLHNPGALVLPMPENADTGAGFVYIPGTTILRPIKRVGSQYVLDSIPHDLVAVVHYGVKEKPESQRLLLEEVIKVIADSIIISEAVRSNWPAIKGVLWKSATAAAAGTEIRLIPEDFTGFLPAERPAASDTAGILGNFLFTRTYPGNYCLTAFDRPSGMGFYLGGLEVNASDSVIHLAPAYLKPTGAITVLLPDSLLKADGALYVPGTGVFELILNEKSVDKHFTLTLPPGSFPAFLHQSIEAGRYDAPLTLAESLTVIENDTLVIGLFHNWSHCARITFNTTASGANIGEDLINFPALIRLDTSNFDFSQAQPDGRDIRFAKPDSTPIPYDIELWDTQRKTAVLWVNIDTVKGNSVSQEILMFWGNHKAYAFSDAGAVFDTANGFAGVWHLGEAGGTAAGSYRDATRHQAHGTGVSMDAKSQAEAIAGRGQYFDGQADYITISHDEHFNFTEAATISLWAKIPKFDKNFQAIITKGDRAWRLQRYGSTQNLELACDSTHHRRLSGSFTITDDQWHHITAVFKNPSLKLYIDGLLDTDTLVQAGIIDRTSDPVWIGNNSYVRENDRFYEGYMDEVRLSAANRSAAWIRLSYESQKPGSGFYVIRKE